MTYTYLELINILKNTSLAQPNINTVVREFLHLNREDTVYSAIVIQDRDGDRTIINNQDYITFTWHIGYVDRLTDDESNRDHIFSTGIGIINNIVNKLRDLLSPEIEIGLRDKFTTFNQRFTANCAGVYIVIYMNMPISECEDYESHIFSTFDMTFDMNGVYHYVPSPSQIAFDDITIRVDVQPKEEVHLIESITENGEYHYEPAPGKVYDSADIEVNVPEKILKRLQTSVDISPSTGILEYNPATSDADGYNYVQLEIGVYSTNISKRFTSNGHYTYEIGDQEIGNNYIESVDIEVSVPSDAKPEESLVEVISSNGSYNYDPSAGSVFSSVAIDVDVHPSSSLSRTYTSNSVYHITGEWKDADITVAVSAEKPEESLVEAITSNGSYSYTPTPGSVYNSVAIDVDVHPTSSLSKSYTTNGTKTITGEFNGGTVNINVHPSSSLSRTYTSNSVYHINGEWKNADITVAVPSTVTVSMSQAAYDNLSLIDQDTIYLING